MDKPGKLQLILVFFRRKDSLAAVLSGVDSSFQVVRDTYNRTATSSSKLAAEHGSFRTAMIYIGNTEYGKDSSIQIEAAWAGIMQQWAALVPIKCCRRCSRCRPGCAVPHRCHAAACRCKVAEQANYVRWRRVVGHALAHDDSIHGMTATFRLLQTLQPTEVCHQTGRSSDRHGVSRPGVASYVFIKISGRFGPFIKKLSDGIFACKEETWARPYPFLQACLTTVAVTPDKA
jgi:hypothetical protein